MAWYWIVLISIGGTIVAEVITFLAITIYKGRKYGG